MSDIRKTLEQHRVHVLAHPAAAVTLAILSYLAFTAMDTTVQVLVLRGIPSVQIFLARMGINAFFCLAYFVIFDRPTLLRIITPSSDTAWLWLRGLSAATALGCGYTCLGYLTLSEYLTLLYLRPFPVAALTWWFLNEGASKRQMVASVISFSAVLLVVQPDAIFPRHSNNSLINVSGPAKLFGIFLAFASVMASSVDALACRKMISTFNTVSMLFAYVATGTILAPIWIAVSGIRLKMDLSMSSWGGLLLVTSFGLCAQLLIVMAMQRATAVKIAIVGYFQIIFSSILQTVILHEAPNILEVLGMVIIMIAGIWCIVEKTEDTESDDEEGCCLPLRDTSRAKYLPVATDDDLDEA